jgi:hypothetical protein
MGTRSTLALLMIALGLGGYVYFVEILGKQRRSELEEEAKRLVSLPSETIQRVRLQIAGEPDAVLERAAEGAWRVVEPVEWPADDFALERLLEGLGELNASATIEPVPDEVAQFGLGEDARRLSVSAGDQSVTLHLGKRTPVGSARYVSLSSHPGRIYAVAYTGTTPLEPSLLDVRDKRVSDIEVEEVRSMLVRIGDEPEIRVERDGDSWRLTVPLSVRADAERIERTLDDLLLARATEFVDAPGDLAEHGLAPPTARVEIAAGSGSLKLALGRKEEDGWLRRGEETTLLKVPDRVVGGLPRDLFEYRHKRVISLDEDTLAELELFFPREEIRYRFAREERRWVPVDHEIRVDSLKLSDLVLALQELDATAVEEAPADLERLGLSPARVRVSARGADGVELGWLELGDPDPERGLAARASTGDEVWRVPNDLGEDVPLSLDAFRSGFASDAPPEEPDEPASGEAG